MLTFKGRQNGDKYSMHTYVHIHVPYVCSYVHIHAYVFITLIRKVYSKFFQVVMENMFLYLESNTLISK